jgi:hypothetical protein
MKKPTLICLIGLVLAVYGVWTVKYSVSGGSILPGIIAVVPFVGAVGLFLKKSWSRYFVYLFTVATVPWWTVSTVWFIWRTGWPYYPTTAESLLGLLPGVFLSLICVGSSWIVHRHFRIGLAKAYEARSEKSPSRTCRPRVVTWRKTLFVLLAALIATSSGGLALLDHLFSGMCSTTVIDEVASPNRKLKAILFQIDCGATTGLNSHVAIVPSDKDVSDKGSLSESFLAVDGNHGHAPAGKGGGPEVRMNWMSDTRLEIKYHDLARIIRAQASSKGIEISYHTFH